jgi:hypothetical protein
MFLNNCTYECRNVLNLRVYFYEIGVVDSTTALVLERVRGGRRGS